MRGSGAAGWETTKKSRTRTGVGIGSSGNSAIRCFAERPRAAFFAVRFDWDKVETSRLKRLLNAIATVDTEPAGQYEIDAYYLSKALDALGGRPGVTGDEMAQLEFACSDALLSLRGARRDAHGIPNLERRISESPGLFVQALALVFKRNGDGQGSAGVAR